MLCSNSQHHMFLSRPKHPKQKQPSAPLCGRQGPWAGKHDSLHCNSCGRAASNPFWWEPARGSDVLTHAVGRAGLAASPFSLTSPSQHCFSTGRTGSCTRCSGTSSSPSPCTRVSAAACAGTGAGTVPARLCDTRRPGCSCSELSAHLGFPLVSVLPSTALALGWSLCAELSQS